MYIAAILDAYKDIAELVGLCDSNTTRMAFTERLHRERYGAEPIPQYHAADFDRMIRERRPDTVIVTSMDCTHARYIVEALRHDRDVTSEQPMATTAALPVDGRRARVLAMPGAGRASVPGCSRRRVARGPRRPPRACGLP
jgi:hypothetical protein